MVIKPEQQKMQQLLTEAITVLCKNGLSFNSHINVEALIGITIDDNDVFLVSVKEAIQSLKDNRPVADSMQFARPRITASRKRPAVQNEPTAVQSTVAEGLDTDMFEPQLKKQAPNNNCDDVIHIKGEEESDDETVGVSGQSGYSGMAANQNFPTDQYASQQPNEFTAETNDTGQTDQFMAFSTADQDIDNKDSIFSQPQVLGEQSAIGSVDVAAFPIPSQAIKSSPGHQSGVPYFGSNSNEEPSNGNRRRSGRKYKSDRKPEASDCKDVHNCVDNSVESQENLWQCNVCGMSCKNGTTLKIHMQAHLGSLKHRCPHCPKDFWNAADVKGHVAAKHSQQKQFACKMCGKTFSYNKTLKEHTRKSCVFVKNRLEMSRTEALPDYAESLPEHTESLPEHTESLPEHTESLPEHTESLPAE